MIKLHKTVPSTLTLLGLLVCLGFIGGCGNQSNNGNENIAFETEAPIPKRIMPPIPAEIGDLTTVQLCQRIQDIKVLPNRVPEETDPIYESLIRKGDEALPCLLERITDTKRIADPRYSVPTWDNYAVGDSAVFILVDILGRDDREREKLLIEMLPPKYEEEWKTNGIYAYFNYVSEPRKRKELQAWWKKWLTQNKR